jgi:hypothetical protein
MMLSLQHRVRVDDGQGSGITSQAVGVVETGLMISEPLELLKAGSIMPEPLKLLKAGSMMTCSYVGENESA